MGLAALLLSSLALASTVLGMCNYHPPITILLAHSHLHPKYGGSESSESAANDYPLQVSAVLIVQPPSKPAAMHLPLHLARLSKAPLLSRRA